MAKLGLLLTVMCAACGSGGGGGDPDGPAPPADANLGPDAPPAPATGIERCAQGDGTLASAWGVSNQHGALVSMTMHDNGIVVLGSVDNSVKQWAISEAGVPLVQPFYGTPFEEGLGDMGALAFSQSGDVLVGGDVEGAVFAWTLDSVLSSWLDTGDQPLAAVAINPAETEVLVADTSFGGNLRVWDRGGTMGPQLATSLWNVSDALYVPGTSTLVVAGHIYSALAIETRDTGSLGTVAGTWTANQATGQRLRVLATPSGARLVAAGSETFVVLATGDLAAGPIAIAEATGHDAMAIALTPSGRVAATISTDGKLRLWDVDTATSSVEIDVPISVGVGIDATGDLLLVGDATGFLRALTCS